MPENAPIAYLGPEGTFSHLLARKRFGENASLLPCPDLSGVFRVLQENENAQAVVPIENSSGGTIYDTMDLLIRNAGKIHVREDLVLDVRLALLGRQGGEVREIYSHFAPLQHHREWLETQYPGAEFHPVASTAVAASLAARSQVAVALASPGAASIYGLDVLRFPIRPEVLNVTRFYVIGHSLAPARENAPHKTALVFRLKNRCGSLHSFLGHFSRAGVNLRMIVSRPVPGHPETYVFFVEVDGAATAQNAAPSSPVDTALAGATTECETLASLGSFPVGDRFDS